MTSELFCHVSVELEDAILRDALLGNDGVGDEFKVNAFIKPLVLSSL